MMAAEKEAGKNQEGPSIRSTMNGAAGWREGGLPEGVNQHVHWLYHHGHNPLHPAIDALRRRLRPKLISNLGEGRGRARSRTRQSGEPKAAKGHRSRRHARVRPPSHSFSLSPFLLRSHEQIGEGKREGGGGSQCSFRNHPPEKYLWRSRTLSRNLSMKVIQISPILLIQTSHSRLPTPCTGFSY